ncbi:hypothetical protein [Sporomusa sp. KB1]|jgi:hypothetical protein|uniref:rolling circle replication-associated protein n=1 Tax=Sporomusa sp. KB1 TaxID=943346 RepID=UPI00119E622D|nr:hypothetical protein [Sporomusa sp. KB1]TWH49620.1 hypothetical protein Salpa_5859 [Sporomusa sp. KB1]
MSYKRITTKAGNVTDVVVCHDAKHNSPKRPRSKNRKKTTETQKKHNDRRSRKSLYLLICANYKADDLYLTLTYGGEAPPPEKAKEHIDKFLRALRRLHHKHGVPLKYIITTEMNRIHHHMLINNIGLSITQIKKLWDKHGFSKIQLFGGEPEDCKRLANYMEKDLKKQPKNHKRNWNCSQNLIHPKPIKIIVPASTWREPIKPPKGYYLDKDSVMRGETEAGYPYLHYQLIKLLEEDST